MKQVKYIGVILIIMVYSCASSKPKASLEQIEALNTLIKSQEFNIESDIAYPRVTYAIQQALNSGLLPPGSTAGAISLIGNSNYLKVSGSGFSQPSQANASSKLLHIPTSISESSTSDW